MLFHAISNNDGIFLHNSRLDNIFAWNMFIIELGAFVGQIIDNLLAFVKKDIICDYVLPQDILYSKT